MPVSLLTPIATDLRVTEGQVGQAIGMSGLFAVATSLFISAVTRGIDRRALLLGLAGLMVVSGVIVALAPNYPHFMFGRAIIGIVIGGFWSLSAATVMRLVQEDAVPKALGLLNGGNALAMSIAAPVGSYIGQFVGWRGAFFSVVPLGILTFAWLFVALPKMPSVGRADSLGVFRVLRESRVRFGMAAVALFFMGQFALFTYLRPFLEVTTGVSIPTLSLLYLGLGVAGLAGSFAIGFALNAALYRLFVIMPLLMAAVAVGLIMLGNWPTGVAVLLVLWGFIGTAAPVAWWSWLARTLPDQSEAGGGLMVAVIQLAITLGASAGGLLFDLWGVQAAFALSAGILVLSGIAALFANSQAAAVLSTARDESQKSNPRR